MGHRSRSPHGRAELDRAFALGGRGPYVVQAAIASLHADEPRDWRHIAVLYGELARLTDSPVVELNRAVAVAEAEGPEAGPRASSISSTLDDYRADHRAKERQEEDRPQYPFDGFQVVGADPHRFDADYDGIGCEPLAMIIMR